MLEILILPLQIFVAMLAARTVGDWWYQKRSHKRWEERLMEYEVYDDDEDTND